MRKILLALSVLVAMTAAVSTATAQNQITLDGSSNSMTFTGTGGGNWTLSLPSVGLKDTGVGGGTLLTPGCTPSTPCAFDITQPTGVTITGTETGTGSNVWNITQSGALDFSFGTGGSLLTGTLQLVDLTQTGATGSFNDDLTVNLAITGGSVASILGPSAILDITIDFAKTKGVAGVLGNLTSGQTLKANISDGELTPTAEPVSMVLVGSGLLLLGGFVRRRRRV